MSFFSEGCKNVRSEIATLNNGVARLCCLGPVHSNDSCIPMLAWFKGVYGPKTHKIQCPIIDTGYSNLLYIHQHHLVLEAGTITRSQRAAAGSWSFPMLQKSYRQLFYRGDGERSPKIDVKCFITATFGHYIWKAISAEASKRGTTNMKLELQRVCSIDRMPHPLPVIYTCGRKRVRLRCRSTSEAKKVLSYSLCVIL